MARMHETATCAHSEQPVMYAGRFKDQIQGIDLLNEFSILGDWDVLPLRLTPMLDEAPLLIVLDLLSFPFESLGEDHWDIPLVIALPTGLEPAALEAVFGESLFDRLTPFDFVVARNSQVLQQLTERYNWSRCQTASSTNDDLPSVVQSIIRTIRDHPRSFKHGGEHGYQASTKWQKSVHRTRFAAIARYLDVLRGSRSSEFPLNILQVGVTDGRWIPLLKPDEKYAGADTRSEYLANAKSDYPTRRFDLIGPDFILPFGEDSYDVVLAVSLVSRLPTPLRRLVLSEMWRTAKPGGLAILLDCYVSDSEMTTSPVQPMPVLRFLDLVLDTSLGRVILDHVETLHPGQNMRRWALIGLRKIAPPSRL